MIESGPSSSTCGTNTKDSRSRRPNNAADLMYSATPQFDIVTDYSDHYFREKDCFTNADSKLHKRIMKEWGILNRGLPDSIFVRAYEGRIELLRAVIIGAAGTPYHDALFFFDLAFPSDYPKKPPSISYLSHGLHLNPNLYGNGYVCLSLLNTWIGSKNERWNPSRSTALQVLLSLQGLVLNEQPYYNEPLINFISDAKSSLRYNEHVYLLSCKSMLYLWRSPPKNFERFVREHFVTRGKAILRACKAYAESEAQVGHYYQQDPTLSKSSIKVSKKSKKLLENTHLLLEAAFIKNQEIMPGQLKTNNFAPCPLNFLLLLIVVLFGSHLFFYLLRQYCKSIEQ